MTDALCSVCDESFTPREWEERHSDQDGNDVHAQCCRWCPR